MTSLPTPRSATTPSQLSTCFQVVTFWSKNIQYNFWWSRGFDGRIQRILFFIFWTMGHCCRLSLPFISPPDFPFSRVTSCCGPYIPQPPCEGFIWWLCQTCRWHPTCLWCSAIREIDPADVGVLSPAAAASFRFISFPLPFPACERSDEPREDDGRRQVINSVTQSLCQSDLQQNKLHH